MSVLDLQGMESAAPEATAGGSSSSGHSCPSNLSVTLCDGTSGLSVLICH
ncbi:MAG TPA: SapB/AmfS family lanthipeptide [Actinophytocola sp.]|nr:SapB/AmfS family lanthipeptide [Actinophytocola sp.]HEU5475961.1 SapB/AmfS family lanthipeptide [Actinophytocola sp.]